MIITGDYIEGSIGVYFTLSTMAAAALGNTISDVFGLGLAHYVEQFCFFIGIEAPDLTPTQQNMPITQRAGSFVNEQNLLIYTKSYVCIISSVLGSRCRYYCGLLNWNVPPPVYQ